jgi:hypothetical protein
VFLICDLIENLYVLKIEMFLSDGLGFLSDTLGFLSVFTLGFLSVFIKTTFDVTNPINDGMGDIKTTFV